MSDYGLDPKQFVRHILRPTLHRLGLWSRPAEVLVLGTALVESRLRYVDQIDKSNKPGPAFGVFQMEGPTHADIHRNFLRFNRELSNQVVRLATWYSGDFPDPGEMIFNMAYATAMCRVHYRRVREVLPAAGDARGMGAYWKRHYNTPLGKGTVEKAIEHFEFAVNLEGMKP